MIFFLDINLMPYFKNLQTLFIHIPKTGGTNIENFFFSKSKEIPSISHIHSYDQNILFNGHSLQHSTYQEIMDNFEYFQIDKDNLKILTIVRNPYERIMSDIFFLQLADKSDNEIKIEEAIHDYILSENTFDDHKIPQYKFLINHDNEIPEEIYILSQENLNKNMEKLGYSEFIYFCKDLTEQSYISYLSKKSIEMINLFYKKDFEYFGYEMILD